MEEHDTTPVEEDAAEDLTVPEADAEDVTGGGLGTKGSITGGSVGGSGGYGTDPGGRS